MKIIINPEYNYLTSFIHSLPNKFDSEGDVIYKSRNEIRVMDVDGLLLNVKRYKVPFILNRIVYTFFRAPKVVRAYEYAFKILKKGFCTPVPVAYIQGSKCGLIYDSYLITLQSECKRNFYEFGDGDWKNRADILRAFAIYTARLHEAGIYHKDYSPGNILFEKKEENIAFCLVDINRMYFGEINREKGCANFARLWGGEDMFRFLAKEYAQARNMDIIECTRLIFKYRVKFWKKYLKRHPAPYKME